MSSSLPNLRSTLPPTAVIFDMDGVLLDSERFVRKHYQQAARQFGWEIDNRLFDSLIGCTSRDAQRQLVEKLGSGFPLEEFNTLVNAAVQSHQDWASLVKIGVSALLTHLRSLELPIGVATSTYTQTACARLKAAGLLGYFKTVVGGDQVAKGKPAPDIFLVAACHLNVPPDKCLVFEDSIRGIEAANAANMTVIHVVDLQPPTSRSRELTHSIAMSCADVPLGLFACVAESCRKRPPSDWPARSG